MNIMRIVLSGLLVALALVGFLGSAAPASAATQFSGGFYPGWIQSTVPPSSLDYSAWTTIYDFGLWPTTTGDIAVGDMQSLDYIPPAVAAAHQAGKQIVMCLGGVGMGSAFAAATTADFRPVLIRNVVHYVQMYGFDGVNVDWEEQVPENQIAYIALLRELRGALDTAFPGVHKTLSVDVDTDQIPPAIVAQVAGSVDEINMMTYWDDGAASFAAYTQAGVPAAKLVVGISPSPGHADRTRAAVQAKVDFAQTNGLKGVSTWQIGDLRASQLPPLQGLVVN